MATWTNTTGTATPAAPVVLREASIAATGAAEDEFEIALIGEPDVNPTLTHLLQAQYGVSFPADLEDLLGDGTDPTAVFERVRKEAATVPGFAIQPRHVLGTFSYAKLPMVNDLAANAEALIAHDVVAALAGHRPAQQALATSGTAVDVADPDRQPPSDEFLVLDADSSQSYAINAAVAGQSLVVSGPPGTGKSQTIANLVATLVARGQSVLFVAEKRAAITAVLDRLQRVGLADLVLDLHGGAGSRREVAESLASGLRAASSIARPDQQVLHETLVSSRNRLNAHDSAMHNRRQPWNVTVFDAQCALIDLRSRHGDAADTSIRLRGADLTALDGDAMRNVSGNLHEFASLGGLTLTRADSLWAGASIVSSEQAQAALDAAARLDAHTAPDTRRVLDHVLQQTGLRAPSTLGEWASALALLDQVAQTLAVLRSEVFAAQLAEMVAATAPKPWRKQNPTWPGATAGWSARRRIRKQAAALWTAPSKPDKHTLHAALRSAMETAGTWSRMSVDGGPPRLPHELAEVEGRFAQLTRELAALGAYLSGTDFTALPAIQLQPTLHALAADDRTLRKMPRINELGAGFARAGLDPLIQELRTRRPDPTLAVAIFHNCWYHSVLDRAGFDDQVIATFDGGLQDSTASTFRMSDTDHIAQAVARVRRAAAEQLVAARDKHDGRAPSSRHRRRESAATCRYGSCSRPRRT